ncbi:MULTISPECIES: helix-turn-helix transcriptional regulator [unclassified Bacillus (in: firmicutes)]|uniref:helix-turn-helix transcriptional regulator n=1 Tax=unclassified Bacillus (in: firmicutes) TaxID=185979 RepID=UPI001BE9A6AD|nr:MULTISPECIES: helix-turn-helix transcriptional regulator [unclassified Bacillus (in: firmicutes)]MBT2615095.1 helix-turn-helix transcriptional regulator [Bacillus sp. ISL-78]MBT2627712.1 helix-turn-helix transcriptional regulator [Bacillus sp. ISL-101]
MILTLKQARLLRGFTQREIASKLGVHVQTYSKMEKQPDDVTIKEAKKICDILDLSYDFIFFNVDSTLSRGIESSSTY